VVFAQNPARLWNQVDACIKRAKGNQQGSDVDLFRWLPLSHSKVFLSDRTTPVFIIRAPFGIALQL